MKIVEPAKALATDCETEYSGTSPGEKIHEVLISEDEVRMAIETDDMYFVESVHPWWKEWRWEGGKPMPDDFKY